jgi:tight adherence protein B
VASAGEGDSMIPPQMKLLLKPQPTGTLGILNGMLQEYKLPQMIETKIIQADLKTSALIIILSCLGCAALGFGCAFIWVPILAVQIIVALVFSCFPVIYVSVMASRRLKKFNAGLADAIDMMARALRAGHSMTASINVIAEQSLEPVRSEFSEVFKQQNFGMPLRDAMALMLERVPSQDLRVMVTGILVQKETGGNLAEILDRTAETIRARIKIQGEIKTHTAQGRMTGYILCSLPVVLLVIINFLNPGYSKVLIDTPIGHTISYIGIALIIIGGLIIRQIINGIEV